ncbi:hypothetical protein [Limnofasciculus baicalensis]|nr:hypothetical protein [Limnofasciculus baicalensis]
MISLVPSGATREDTHFAELSNGMSNDNSLLFPFGARSERITLSRLTIVFGLIPATDSTNYWEILVYPNQPGKITVPFLCGNTSNLPQGENTKQFPRTSQLLDPFTKVFVGVKKIGSPGTIWLRFTRLTYTIQGL